MLNYWWVTRPKRKLNSIPEVLASFADLSLNQEWEGQRNSHLAYEDALEEAREAAYNWISVELEEEEPDFPEVSHEEDIHLDQDEFVRQIMVVVKLLPDND